MCTGTVNRPRRALVIYLNWSVTFPTRETHAICCLLGSLRILRRRRFDISHDLSAIDAHGHCPFGLVVVLHHRWPVDGRFRNDHRLSRHQREQKFERQRPFTHSFQRWCQITDAKGELSRPAAATAGTASPEPIEHQWQHLSREQVSQRR